jgi:hypothetical protein
MVAIPTMVAWGRAGWRRGSLGDESIEVMA